MPKPRSLWFQYGDKAREVFEEGAHGNKLDLGHLPLVPKSIVLNDAASLVSDQGRTKYDKKGLQKRVGNPDGNTCATAIVVTGTPDPGYPGAAWGLGQGFGAGRNWVGSCRRGRGRAASGRRRPR